MDMGWDFAADSLVMKLQGITILFSHAPQWKHRADINIHGHFHDLHREVFDRRYLPLSLEAMGYMPIALDEGFLGPVAGWVKTHKIPKLKEIYELKQNHRPLTERDMYGRMSKETFTLEFLAHSLDEGQMDTNEAAYIDVEPVLVQYGITKEVIRGTEKGFGKI